MRLTLRTLLAYVDGLLDAEDREDLAKKIEGSDVATELLHRTRDSMRRLRLGAPPVEEVDGGIDANTVAEYLDNTMPPEQVADFERVCIDSEAHLAEVASCHQVLVRVLGEPAEVPASVRTRVLDMPAQAELLLKQREEAAQHAEDAKAVNISTTAAPASSKVPDYLQPTFLEKHRGKILLAVAVGIVGIFLTLWRPESPEKPSGMNDQQLAQSLQDPEVEEGSSASDQEAGEGGQPLGDPNSEAPPFQPQDNGGEESANADTSGDSPTADSPTHDGEEADSDASPEQNGDNSTDEETSGEAIAAPPEVPDENETPSNETPSNNGSAERGSGIPVLGGDDLSVPAVNPDLRLPEFNGATGEETAPTPGDTAVTPPPPVTDGETSGEGTAGPGDATTNGEAATTDTEPVTAVDSTPAAPIHVATLLDNEDLLLRFDPAKGSWFRMPAHDRLYEGNQLLALPASRPTVGLVSGVSLQLQPATRLVLSAEQAGDLPDLGGTTGPIGLQIIYGRIILLNPSRNEASVRLRLGNQVSTVQLGEGSALAVAVQRIHGLGTDPTMAEPNVVADLYATQGTITWQAAGMETEVEAPSHWRVDNASVGDPKPIDQTPQWISKPDVSGTDRLALSQIEPELTADRPTATTLAELANHRRAEVQSLAARASVHVGAFQPLVSALGQSDRYAAWDGHIETLEKAIALGPAVAEKVRAAFHKREGQADGERLFRILWGYSDDQLKNGGLLELIQFLEHNNLEFRVLAFNRLREATGLGLSYRPQDTPLERERGVTLWRARYNNGELERRVDERAIRNTP